MVMSDIVYTEAGSAWCSCDGPDRWCDACGGRLPTGTAHKEACRIVAQTKTEDSAEIHHLYAQLERADKARRQAHDDALDLAIKIAEDFSGTLSDREIAFMIANKIRRLKGEPQ